MPAPHKTPVPRRNASRVLPGARNSAGRAIVGTEFLRRPYPLFNRSARVEPRAAGLDETRIPADCIASIFDCAPPLPPEMIAPAWPMRRPGGAVSPAMNPTVGFFVL